jgi:hypothetical protein
VFSPNVKIFWMEGSSSKSLERKINYFVRSMKGDTPSSCMIFVVRGGLLSKEFDSSHLFVVLDSSNCFPTVDDVVDGEVCHVGNHGVVCLFFVLREVCLLFLKKYDSTYRIFNLWDCSASERARRFRWCYSAIRIMSLAALPCCFIASTTFCVVVLLFVFGFAFSASWTTEEFHDNHTTSHSLL